MEPQMCPACEQVASDPVEVRSGTSWRDLFGKPPHSFFSNHPMVHVGGRGPRGGIMLFCHTEQDLQGMRP